MPQRISNQAAKSKGRKFQQKVRDRIIETYKEYGVVADDVKSTAMGQGGEDVQLSPFARGLFNYSIECKKHKSFAIYKPYEQCSTNAPMGAEPIVFIEGDRKKPLAVMDMEHFFKMEEELQYMRERLDNAGL